MRWLLCLIAISALVVIAENAYSLELFGSSGVETPDISIEVIPSHIKMSPGIEGVVAIAFNIPWQYHLQDDLDVELDGAEGIEISKIIKPQGKYNESAGMVFYYGKPVFALPFKVSNSAQKGERSITAKVHYSPCTEQLCLGRFEKDITFRLTIGDETFMNPAFAIVSKMLPIPKTANALLEKKTDEEQPASFEGRISTAIEKGSWLAFLLVFLGGIATSLTPCVFPMIPITVSFFGTRSTSKLGRGFVMSLIYVLGIVITYSILGVIAGATGAAFGMIAEHPAVIVAVVLIFLLLAASMFGAFEFQLPAFLLTKLSIGTRKKGFLSPLLLGLVLGFIAAPCVGPVLIAILTYIAKKQSILYGFWLMFFFSLGMGVLFIILGTFSGAIKRLPRSGVWMITVKRIFGSIMIAMAIYFARPLMPLQAFGYVVAIAFITFGAFTGAFTRICDKPTVLETFKKVAAVIAVVIGIYGLVANMMASGFFMQKNISGKTIGPQSAVIEWVTSFDRALSRAKEENKIIMIDFYSENCPACIEMDRFTYSNPEVIQVSKKFIPAKLYSRDNNSLVRKYGIIGYPATVFLMPDGTQIGSTEHGFVNADKFLKFMGDALQGI
jgi:thioredoxin:protein disulfide reductase